LESHNLDFAVMYILSKEDEDFCRMKFQSIIGDIERNERAFVIKNNRAIPTSSIFRLNKIITEERLPSGLLFNSYQEKHEEWMTELKANVKKFEYKHKTSYAIPTKYYGTNTVSGYYGTNTVSGFKLPSAYRDMFKIKEGIIEELFHSDSKDISQLSPDKIKQICGALQVEKKDVYEAFQEIVKNERTLDDSEIDTWVNHFPLLNFRLLPTQKQIEICKTFECRRHVVLQAIDSYFNKRAQK